MKRNATPGQVWRMGPREVALVGQFRIARGVGDGEGDGDMVTGTRDGLKRRGVVWDVVVSEW